MGSASSVPQDAVEYVKNIEGASEVVRSKILDGIEKYLVGVFEEWGSSELEVVVYRAHGLENRDRKTLSDPYVVVSVEHDPNKFVLTPKVSNDLSPSWGSDGYTLTLENVIGQDTLLLEIFDADESVPNPTGRRDDYLGRASIPLGDPHGSWGKPITLDVIDAYDQPSGTLTFSYNRKLRYPELPPNDDEMSVMDLIYAFVDLLPGEVVRGDAMKSIREDVCKVLKALALVLRQREEKFSESPFMGLPSVDMMLLNLHDSLSGGSFDAYVQELKDFEPSGVEKSFPHCVVRKEIRRMSVPEQERFVNAIKTSMQSDTQGGSEWLRVAGYHGWPSNDEEGYCVHKIESFPGWHRAYLLEMEKVLQEADRKNGNDGHIAMPYWDFSRYKLNGQVMPTIIRDQFSEDFEFPENFFPDIENPKAKNRKAVAEFKRLVFKEIRKEQQLLWKLQDGKVVDICNRVVDTDINKEHWQAASTENKSNATSCETPHNVVHNALGYPLVNVRFAAFHPMFWLLHCNTDRIYEKYLQIESREECMREVVAHQKSREENGYDNLYVTEFEPFQKVAAEQKKGGQDGHFSFEESFLEIDSLGHVYDQLPPRPLQKLQELPTLAWFRNVDVGTKLVGETGPKSFDVHVLVTTKSEAASFREEVGKLASGNDYGALRQLKNYAGAVSFFGGKGPKCENCVNNPLINASLLLNDVLVELGDPKRSQLELVTVAEDEHGDFSMLNEIQEGKYGENCTLPSPTIEGPYFEKSFPTLSKGAQTDGEYTEEIRHLQQLLTKYGYYGGSLDGDFGDKTNAAIRALQRSAGLKVDGVIGKQTMARITQPRYDTEKDRSKPAEVEQGRAVESSGERNFEAGQEIKYWVGTAPGYLQREDILADISEALKEWENIGIVKFTMVDNRDDSDIHLLWGDHSDENAMKFDGPGGEIARASAKGIVFDSSERWVTGMKGEPKRRAFRLRPVVLHEIGHVLGLGHCDNSRQVMSPYYTPTRVALTPDDKASVRALYGSS